MIKNLAWNTFKNTGDINTFLELLKVENAEKDIQTTEKKDLYGDNQNKGNSTFRK